MPELPEVESVKRGLESSILNQIILNTSVSCTKIVSGKGTKRLSNPEKELEFLKNIKRRRINKISRRAKIIIIELDNKSVVLVHLKMTGQLVYKSNNKDGLVVGGHPIKISQTNVPNKHTHIIFELEKGSLYYNDVRKFGYVLYYTNIDSAIRAGHFQDLGLEPLDTEFKFDIFRAKLIQAKGLIKKVFLEQSVVVGLGNIYADEVAFASGVLPTRRIESLKDQEIDKLYNNIKRILNRAVELGGSSVADYLLADGTKGNYAREHKVYKKGGKPCQVCGNKLIQNQVAGRTTVYCKVCQV